MLATPDLDTLFFKIQPLVYIAGIVTWIVALRAIILAHKAPYGFVRSQHKRNFFKACVFFLLLLGFENVGQSFFDSIVENQINPLLHADVLSLVVEGNKIEDQSLLVSALKNMSHPSGHHSHPTCRYTVSMATTQGLLTLKLARDSGNPREYWVYYPSAEKARTIYLGRIFTGTLEPYSCTK